MNPEHREIIESKREYLIENVPFEAVMPSLRNSGMFNKYMWDDINSMSDALDFLPFRGPTAFQRMIDALKTAGYEKEAAVLESPHGDEVDDDDDSYYKMSSTPLGYCLIINNVDFSKSHIKLGTRDGSDVDAKSLKEFFEIDFHVFPEKDLTAAQMQSTLDAFLKKDFKLVDSVIVVILSHGGSHGDKKINGLDFVYGTDGKKIYVNDIYNMFDNKKEGLQNKPKMFFFVACRGDSMDYGALKSSGKESFDSTGMGIPSTNDSVMPSRGDIFIYHSTLPNEFSLRHDEEGSFFIQVLVPILREYYLKEDLESMMKRVNKILSTKMSEDYCCFNSVHSHKFNDTKKIMLCRRK